MAGRPKTPHGSAPRGVGAYALALGAAVGLTLVASACGTPHTGSPPGASVQAPAGPAPVARTEPAYAAALKPKLQQIITETLAPGAVVLVRSPELGDWTATFGTRAIGSSAPITRADHVRIGSNTKTWTGTVVLQLVDEGKLALDDAVAKYRPDVPNGPNITIEHLLTMRSGLYNYSETLELNRTLDTDPTKAWAPEELLALAYRQPPYFPPGQGYHYSNTNTVLLGLIVEQLTGHPIERAFQTRIFTPLGLANTRFPARNDNALPVPFARGYQFGTNVETIASEVLPAPQQAAAKAGTLKPFDATLNNPSWAWSAGAGISTVDDLARYAEALVGGGLLSEAMQRRRLASIRPVDPGNPGIGYGWGLAKLGPLYGHTGELPGYNSVMAHDPEQKITIIVWSSLNAAPDGRPPAVEMAKAIVAELYPPR
jgi:D-alanyl-D-alanine carboxypeptidase